MVPTLPTFGWLYDFRNPESWRQSWTARYRGLMEQIVWAERELGFGSVWLSEHHFVDDGYTPSVLSLAAAVAMCTEQTTIGTNLLLLPLHHPLRVAEDGLTADVLSGGRFRLGVGNGYREEEFLGFGRSLAQRKNRMEESMEIVRRAFKGETFSHEGRYVKFPELHVAPPSVRPGGPEIWMGGVSEAAADRAARLADGFLPAIIPTIDLYLAARRRHKRPVAEDKVAILQWTIVGEDPEKTFHEVGVHAMYQVNQYMSYGFFGPPDQIQRLTDPRQLLADGHYTLHDASSAADTIVDLVRRYPVVDVHNFAAFPGESIESSSRRIEYFASRVVPLVRERLLVTPLASTTTT